jgi:hypothetical protein
MKQAKPKRGRPVKNHGFLRINVRLPPDLLKRVVDATNKDASSINSEIIRRLANSFGMKV